MASLLKPFTQSFSHAAVPSLTSRHYIITGGTNGIGLSISRTLFSRGARVTLIGGHRQQVGEQAVAYIRSGDLSAAPEDYAAGFGSQGDESGAVGEMNVLQEGEVEWVSVDLEDLKDVARVAKETAQKIEQTEQKRLDGVFFLAGKGVNEFSLTPDGYDSHLTLNNLSHHLLLSHFLPYLLSTSKRPDSDVRIVQMSSELHRATLPSGPSPGLGGSKFKEEDEFKKDVGPNGLYARTKLGVILFTKALVQRHLPPSPATGETPPVLAYATHPGAVATGQQDQFKPAYGETLGSILGAVVRPFMSRPDQGAISALWAGLAPDARDPKWQQGSYFTEAKEEGKETEEARDQEMIDNFYLTSESIIQKVTGGQLGPWSAPSSSGSSSEDSRNSNTTTQKQPLPTEEGLTVGQGEESVEEVVAQGHS